MSDECIDDIFKASQLMIESIENGKKILWCGNGGSAADSQHMAAELMGGLRSHDRSPISSLALTTDTSFITAWSNDTDYESIFSRQIEGLGLAGDVLIAISTSGNSTNVINAINLANDMGLVTVGLTNKSGGKMKEICSVLIRIPSMDTQRIQEGHILAEHILCERIEAYFQ
jgi:D-sedoheptulose 7-phosphate isomerase